MSAQNTTNTDDSQGIELQSLTGSGLNTDLSAKRIRRLEAYFSDVGSEDGWKSRIDSTIRDLKTKSDVEMMETFVELYTELRDTYGTKRTS